MRQIAVAIFSGANPNPKGAICVADRAAGPPADVEVSTPRAGTFARTG
jgi:hypothetical protein